MNKWVVTVSGNGCYQYGPFETYEAAEEWAEANTYKFYGRIVWVHVLRLIEPFTD